MKLYTKTGDDGTTGLFGGQRVGKDSLRIEVCGTVDELNCQVGLAAVVCRHEDVGEALRRVQHVLFELGAELANPSAADGERGGGDVLQDHVQWMEGAIDRACAVVEPMKQFILPGGSELSARLHTARAVSRRAERLCVTLSSEEPLDDVVLVYLNRLSDLLFALARWGNHLDGVADVAWRGQGG